MYQNPSGITRDTKEIVFRAPSQTAALESCNGIIRTAVRILYTDLCCFGAKVFKACNHNVSYHQISLLISKSVRFISVVPKNKKKTLLSVLILPNIINMAVKRNT